ncbi:uncharacterized protein LOC108105130 [Drosophila eugracilis]|uniref:uncharacterized protein LOC108105130 n=1 Tax=Drosophila eugracilis TaxID=29029 RepID=UPI001BD9417A|nr:uncharacterized protein LOC108105130 [Drosophila eugracilis]
MTSDDGNEVCSKLVEFRIMDNTEKSALDFAENMLSDMDQFWGGTFVDGLLDYLKIPNILNEPRQCVKSLRVLHEITTHCTEVDLLRLSTNTDVLDLLRTILETPKIRKLIVRTSLTLVSNFILDGWPNRDCIFESGILNAVLKLMNPHRQELPKYKALMGQIIYLLYQYLRYKNVGPKTVSLERIAKALAKVLKPSQDVDIILPLLKIARLLSEYNSETRSVMIFSGLISRVAPFVLHPLPEIKRETIFILANTCMQRHNRKKDDLYRFSKRLINLISDLLLSGPVEIRVLVNHLLCGIIDNQCIKIDMMLIVIPKIIRCASAEEQEIEVRLAAGWTLASLAMHLDPKIFPVFITFKGYNVLCELLHTDLPVQLVRNILSAFVRLIESFVVMKPYWIGVMWETNTWPVLLKLLESRNATVNTLATLLNRHGDRGDVCWIDVLGG